QAYETVGWVALDLAVCPDGLSIFWRADNAYWNTRNGSPALVCDSEKPNRMDLRWDFKVNPTEKLTTERNIWLETLKEDTAFDPKIIAYAGYFRQQDFLSFSVVVAASFQDDNDHLNLLLGGSILANGLRGNPSLPDGFLENDGL